MKIQVRAGIEVVVGTIAMIATAVLVESGLSYVLENYGAKGLLAGLGVIVTLLFMNIVYQIRVSQLKFEESRKVDQ